MESMETDRQDIPAVAREPAAARFRSGQLLFWMATCAVHGVAVAWMAVLVEKFRAPVLLFSLLVGVVLGATLVGMARLCQVGNRPTILLGTVLAAVTAVVGQHYISYRSACREARHDARMYRLAKSAFEQQVLGEMPVPPGSLVEFLRWRADRGFDFLGYSAQGVVAWTIWALDGLLVLAAALLLVAPASRRPYCDRCRSWFGTTRRGSIDPATARRLAAIIRAELPGELAGAGYRLVTCSGACGPTGFELRWLKPGGESSSSYVWLDVERRNQVVQALDKSIGTQ